MSAFCLRCFGRSAKRTSPESRPRARDKCREADGENAFLRPERVFQIRPFYGTIILLDVWPYRQAEGGKDGNVAGDGIMTGEESGL